MLKIILIHSGATEYDQQGRILGTLDVPLSEEGQRQVEVASDQLGAYSLEMLYTAPSESARQTAEKISRHLGIKCKASDLLRNVDHGLWQGMLLEDVRRKQPKVYRQWREQPESVCPPEGEMLETARQRVETWCAKMLKKHKQGAIGIVAPEPLVGLIEICLRGGQLREIRKHTSPGAARWHIIEIEDPGLIKV